MSGLSYLCDYGESDESEPEEVTKKLKLPVPDLSKVATVLTEKYIDDPQLHGGRVRTFPHVRGNWPSYTYIKYPECDDIIELLDQFKNLLANKVSEPCHLIENLHISVSKTFVLKYHLISAFTSSILEAVKNLDSFDVGFDSVESYTNEEHTRTFLALKADHFSRKFLLKICQKIDSVLEEFNLPKFYEDPSFHMSILWWNGDCNDQICMYMKDLNKILVKQSELALKTVTITKIDCKVGNKFYQFNLD